MRAPPVCSTAKTSRRASSALIICPRLCTRVPTQNGVAIRRPCAHAEHANILVPLSAKDESPRAQKWSSRDVELCRPMRKFHANHLQHCSRERPASRPPQHMRMTRHEPHCSLCQHSDAFPPSRSPSQRLPPLPTQPQQAAVAVARPPPAAAAAPP
eukprot:5022407-Pleurochrysis_carterae.AAC.2